MAFFEWTTVLDVGVEAMNDQHQILIDLMNHLYDLVEAGASRGELGKALEELGSYTVEHFANEERYLESISYAGLESHKNIHAELLSTFAEHVAEFKRTGAVERKFFSFLKLWLMSHIKGIDMKYGPLAN